MEFINQILQLVSNIISIVTAYLENKSERMHRAGRREEMRDDALMQLSDGSVKYLRESAEMHGKTVTFSNAQELDRQSQENFFAFQQLFYNPLLSCYLELEGFRYRAIMISVRQSNAILDACNRSKGMGSRPLDNGCMEELTALVTEMRDFIGKRMCPDRLSWGM